MYDIRLEKTKSLQSKFQSIWFIIPIFVYRYHKFFCSTRFWAISYLQNCFHHQCWGTFQYWTSSLPEIERTNKSFLVFCVQNCSDLLWGTIVLVIEKNLRLKTENLQIFWDECNNLFKQWKVNTIFETECFLTCFWRFLRSNTLEQLEFKLEKIIRI